MKIWHGILPGYEELILNRIRESRREYSRKEQRAELLIRNSQFISEYQKLKRACELSDQGFGPGSRLSGEFNEIILIKFCERWGISRRWNMKQASLSEFIETEPGLIYHPIWAGVPVNFTDIKILPDEQRPDYLFIQIDPWTSLEDMKSIWGKVEVLKKAIFGFVDKGKSSFGHALCWYDLNKKFGMSLGNTARLWIQEEAPYIEDKESFKITVREGIKRIDRYIKRLTPGTSLINIPQ